MKKGAKQPELTVEFARDEWYMTLGGEPVVHCLLTRPECAGTWRGLGRIDRFYRHVERDVRRYWAREVYLRACLELADRRACSRPFRPWRVELDTQATFVGEGLISFRRELRERRGGDDLPLIVRRGDVWSLTDGTPRTMSEFFPRRGWRKRVLAHLKRETRRRLAGGESLLDADCERKLARLFDPERFCLTEQGIEVFYPMCAVAAAGEGIPTFTVAREDNA